MSDTSGFIGRSRGRRLLMDLLKSDSQSSSSETPINPPIVGRGRLGLLLSGDSGILTEPNKMLQELSINKTDGSEVKEACHYRGDSGNHLTVTTNYLRLNREKETGIYLYEVRFMPAVEDVKCRYALIAQHKDLIGTSRLIFDGVMIFVPKQFPEKLVRLKSVHPVDNSNVGLELHFKRVESTEKSCHFYNVLFRRVMKELQYIQIKRSTYDPTAPKVIPTAKLEIWPGYVTAVNEYEDGLMLCVDTSHKLLHTTNVLEHLGVIYASSRKDGFPFTDMAKKSLLNEVILTRYNNQTIRIDDINFNSTPMTTFKRNGVDISFKDYYKLHYNIELKSLDQPMLVYHKKIRTENKKESDTMTIVIPPELCYLVGITDTMRNNRSLMMDVVAAARLTPYQRMAAYNKFCQNIENSPAAKNILKEWGLSLSNQPLTFTSHRILIPKGILVGGGREIPFPESTDFGRNILISPCLKTINVPHWILMHSRKDQKFANRFITLLADVTQPMGLKFSNPVVVIPQQDNIREYTDRLRENLRSQVTLVCFIAPTKRDDVYSAFKKLTTYEVPIPSQMIVSNTLANEKRVRSVVQKIALQMNCKLGGSLWTIKIPMKKTMICGIDSFHSPENKSNSVAAFVASMNDTFSSWYSVAMVQVKKEELMNGLVNAMDRALQAYQKKNGYYPEKIIVYRDGIGDGALKLCKEYEVAQIKDALSKIEPEKPKLTFIIVQKRINTKILIPCENNVMNPPPGTVIDKNITQKYLFDFFLVSQKVTQGTVSPCHYIVLEDESNHKPLDIQRLSYRLCYMYYNWTGSVRVPACVQYAHKLASLVGVTQRQPAEKLSELLYYL